MTHLHEEIEDLKDRLLRMADAVHVMFQKALQAVVEGDLDLARSVIESDRLLDQMEIEVDETVIRLFACYQPMATDLRFILNASKMSSTLERMGDRARNIARSVPELKLHPRSMYLEEIVHLSHKAAAMIQDALRAFVRRDGELARDVCRRDDEVDRLRDQILDILIAEMQADPSTIRGNIRLILIARGLERLADLSTNISEDVVNMVEGVIIKHHHEDAHPGPART